MKHAVPNALHPLIAYQGVAFPYMLAGEIEVAIVLAVPTIGPLLVESLINQDIYVTATILLMLSAVLLVGNLLADITLAFVDPRVRLS
jgi:peptide/nickel transport system permease protein